METKGIPKEDQKETKWIPKGNQREVHPSDVSWLDALADYAMNSQLAFVDN